MYHIHKHVRYTGTIYHESGDAGFETVPMAWLQALAYGAPPMLVPHIAYDAVRIARPMPVPHIA
eukprot:622347-Rhodomonas_salina.8